MNATTTLIPTSFDVPTFVEWEDTPETRFTVEEIDALTERAINESRAADALVQEAHQMREAIKAMLPTANIGDLQGLVALEQDARERSAMLRVAANLHLAQANDLAAEAAVEM